MEGILCLFHSPYSALYSSIYLAFYSAVTFLHLHLRDPTTFILMVLTNFYSSDFYSTDFYSTGFYRWGNYPIDAMLFLEFKLGYIIALCT